MGTLIVSIYKHNEGSVITTVFVYCLLYYISLYYILITWILSDTMQLVAIMIIIIIMHNEVKQLHLDIISILLL